MPKCLLLQMLTNSSNASVNYTSDVFQHSVTENLWEKFLHEMLLILQSRQSIQQWIGYKLKLTLFTFCTLPSEDLKKFDSVLLQFDKFNGAGSLVPVGGPDAKQMLVSQTWRVARCA